MALTLTQTQNSSVSQVVRSPGTERQTVPSATPSSAPGAVAPSAPQAAAAGAVGFTLTFDPETQRMILEARDAATGFVIDQMPPKYVVKQFSAQASGKISTSRGTRVDNAS
jgi:hypothetical protein